MAGMGLTFKTLDTTKCLQASKTIVGWLNTGHQREKLTPNADSSCPMCQEPNKTQEHVLQCRNRRARDCCYNALNLLWASITTKAGGSIMWDVLHQCFINWTAGNTSTQIIDLNKYTMHQGLKPILFQAIRDQHLIGWHYAIPGFLSTTWATAYNMEHPKSTTKGILKHWLQPIIWALWKFNSAM